MSEHLEPERQIPPVLQAWSRPRRTPCPGGGYRKLHQHFPPELESSSPLSYWVFSCQSLLRKGRWWTLGCKAAKITAAKTGKGADWEQTSSVPWRKQQSLTYLTRSLDVQVVEPFQDCNSSHHPNGRVVKVAVQHLNYSIQVQGHLNPLRAAWKGERLIQCCNIQLTPPTAGRFTTRQNLRQTSQLKP